MVGAFGMALELVGIEIDLAQRSRRVALRLISEVRGVGVAALASGGNRAGADALAELDHGDEAVAIVAVPPLGARPGLRAEGGERAVAAFRKRHRDARRGIAIGRVDLR